MSPENGPGFIEYSSPKQAKEQGEQPQHRFDLTVNGEVVGGAEIDYFSKPLPLYQVTELWVDHEHKGQGHASQLMGQVEEFLKEKRKPGVVVDAVMEGDPASGMYARRGWQEVPGGYGL